MKSYFKILGAPIFATVANALLSPFYGLVTGIDGDIIFNTVRVVIWIVAGWRLASIGGFGVWKSALSGAVLPFLDHLIIKGGFYLIQHNVQAFEGVLISYCLLWFVPIGFAAIGAVIGKRQKAKECVAGQPRWERVHGWLFLFCLLYIAVLPFLTVYDLTSFWVGYSFRPHPIVGLTAIDIVETVIAVGVVAFGMHTAQSLWRSNSGAVRLAKVFLLTALGCQVVSVVLPFVVGLPGPKVHALFHEAGARLVFGVIWFALWYSYFVMSKRIKTTYTG